MFLLISRFRWFWNRFGTDKILTDAVLDAIKYSKTCKPRYNDRHCTHCDHFTRRDDRIFCRKHGVFL